MNKIEEIKKAASGLKVSDRLFCYSTLKAEDDNWAFGMERYTERNRHFE